MKTSVIIPVYNREALIGSALRSLLRQCGQADLDIIVIDDGSTDRTAEIVDAVRRQEPCVRLIRQPNQGVTSARNTGLAHLLPETGLVAFLDSDDISMPGRFAAEIPLFRGDPELALTYSLMTLANDIDETGLVPTATADICTVRGIGLSTALFRRQAIEPLGGFDPKLKQSEDLDYLIRFFESGRKYLLVDNVAVIYRRHPGNMTRNRDEAKRDFMRALLLSAQRRRRNPAIGDIPRFFDITALMDPAKAMLR